MTDDRPTAEKVPVRRTLIVPAVAVAALALLSLPVPPATATTLPGISIKVNETKLIHGAPIQGVSVQFQANNKDNPVASSPTATTPADCASDVVGCDMIPLTLDVPEDDPDLIEGQAYLLSVVVSWDSGQSVDNLPEVGTIRQNELESYLYQDPQVRDSSGSATFTSSSHNSNPAELNAVSPTSKKFNLVVANYFGVNNGYTLQISLIKGSSIAFDPSDYAKPDLPDYVQPTLPPPSTTPHDSGFGGSDLPPITPSTDGPAPAVEGSGAIVVPNVAPGHPDSTLLAMSNITGTSGLGRHAVAVESTVASDKITKSGNGTVVIALISLPVASLVIAFLLLLRRRKSGAAPAAAVV